MDDLTLDLFDAAGPGRVGQRDNSIECCPVPSHLQAPDAAVKRDNGTSRDCPTLSHLSHPYPELKAIIRAYAGATVELRPRTPIPPAPGWPPRPQVPRGWQDHAGWCRLLTYAYRIENRRWVLSRWATAARGEVRDDTLHLPADLPRGLALAELRTHARICGLRVEVTA
jgi:hypothetical protein